MSTRAVTTSGLLGAGVVVLGESVMEVMELAGVGVGVGVSVGSGFAARAGVGVGASARATASAMATRANAARLLIATGVYAFAATWAASA